MNKRSKLIVCGIAVIAVLCMALPVLFHGTSNECKITSVSAADSRNHSVDTYTVEQDKKKCSVSFTDTAVIDTAFTAEVSTDEPYIIELTVRDSQLPEYREIKDENVAMNTAQTAVKYNADDSVMKRVVYPQNRQLHFSVTMQYKENVSGFIGYSSIKVIPVSKSKEYKLVTSPDKTVEFIIKADDFSKEETDKLSTWSEDLQLYRQQLYQLTGERQPYDGKTIFDFTEQIDYYGLAGNPIFMNSSNLTKDLSTDKSVCIWKYIHEMSHTFDGIEGSYIGNTWNFDSELFANLKMLYVMENNGLSFQDSSEKGADAYLKYSAGNTLKNGIYSSDGFLYLLICRLREVQPDYWNSLQAVFSNAHDSFNETESSTASERFINFFSLLHQELGVNILSAFSDAEKKAVINKYGNEITYLFD